MPKATKSRFAILGMLAMIPESSGYDIKKHMESSTQYFWKETFSSIYPVLEELEQQGLIKQLKNPSKSKRKCNLYSLTPDGQQALEDWLKLPPESEQLRNEFLLKLFFGQNVSRNVIRRHIEKYQSELQSKQAIYLDIQNELAREHHMRKGYPYWLLTLDYGLAQINSALQWCEKALSTI